ncbi:hypothetical protein [Bradyrhizobium canariense]|uniref:hypothetical protein n=1 Tax=Bradyrhizobium canariense TaxID=255045 RepID=UPI000A19199D|nr:hypothetical protein [Bradyrhizobium canariense]
MARSLHRKRLERRKFMWPSVSAAPSDFGGLESPDAIGDELEVEQAVAKTTPVRNSTANASSA